ncbi:hypothetical protein JIN84_18070 [Luteolibacter yonseiensis]|uniref:Uncharacterized protein n=1 Tax=Luteolibacter yonseiensis TaxID=1144680 RepID=A0A934R358_9BACT|nr:hypothetical protein [Luteolibacter yonseiensis]MBK1817533.1 hypothetical protein [Luteolibacter yonseiensis]
MARRYRDDWNPNARTRIDARPPSPEKAAGMTRIHYATDGTVIGAIDRYGMPLGSRVRQGPKDGSAIGNPSTPGLDRQTSMNSRAPDENLSARQALHAEMVRAGRSGITPEMQERANQLGVSGPAWNRVAGAIPEIPDSITGTTAVPAPPPRPESPARRLGQLPSGATQVGMAPFKPGMAEGGLTPQIATNTPGAVPAAASGAQRINRLTGRPFGYTPGDTSTAAPQVASKPPQSDMAKTAQASADLLVAHRKIEADSAKRSAFRAAVQPPKMGISPSPLNIHGFRSAAGLPIYRVKDFALPAVSNPQPVGGPQPGPAAPPKAATPSLTPGSTFRQLTTPPAVMGPPASAKPQPAKPQPAYRTPPALPAGGPAFTAPNTRSVAREQEIEAQRGAKRKAYNAAWNQTPNLPVADPNSVLNKSYKSLRTFFSGHSY